MATLSTARSMAFRSIHGMVDYHMTGARWPKASLLGALGETSRDRMLAQGVMHEYRAALPIIRMGDPTTFVIVLLAGMVKATALSLVGQEVLLAIRVIRQAVAVSLAPMYASECRALADRTASHNFHCPIEFGGTGPTVSI